MTEEGVKVSAKPILVLACFIWLCITNLRMLNRDLAYKPKYQSLCESDLTCDQDAGGSRITYIKGTSPRGSIIKN